MNQPPTEQISSEMLDAATIEYLRAQGYSEKAIQAKKQSDAASWQDGERRALLILEAAGVPALLRDARRYRWLRSQHWSDAPLAVVREPKITVKLGYDLPSLERLDEAIDEAMAKPEGGTGE